jgi:hypothetical protein
VLADSLSQEYPLPIAPGALNTSCVSEPQKVQLSAEEVAYGSLAGSACGAGLQLSDLLASLAHEFVVGVGMTP